MKTDLQKLRGIVEASKKLASVLDLDELLNVILDVALSELEAERGTVFLLDAERGEIFSRILRGNEMAEIRLPLGSGIAGAVAQSGETVIIADAYADPRFNRAVDQRSGFRTRSILCLPMRDGKQTIGVLQLLNKKREEFTDDDAEYLSALAAHMVIAINNARAHKDRLEQERTNKELELAARIQQGLLPTQLPQFGDFRINCYYAPCRTVGGDIYDCYELPDGRIGIMLADVSGKGIPAALITSALHAYMHALVETYQDPGQFCWRLNHLVHGSIPPASYATLMFIEYDPATSRIRYCNCGHVPGAYLVNGDVRWLKTTGPVMGLLPKAVFGVEEMAVADGDLLMLYTDGLSEASTPEDENGDSEEFGLERVRTACMKGPRDAESLLAHLHKEVFSFVAGAPLADDLTMLALTFGTGSAGGRA
jgi:serine phosphatase RsbU (regulator of sigma subunit)